MKRRTIAGLVFLIVGQVVALLIWLIFEENYFVPLLIGSVVGFLAGYNTKNPKTT